ncbi:halocyanin domain-containing protein [Natronomonas sp.]|uniref:halocyanin domain-containing protein n=1 Tax=Natronomonas sp. TaxID=2184060 RepID=UPI00260BE120|nr:halocyanin domain-containing protein [Natronomonas sp.]
MEPSDTPGLSRRDLFRVGVGATAAAATATAASPTYAQETFEYEGWFDDVDSFDGTVDMTGEDEVTVNVGAGAAGLAFDPPAIHVDPGTTVVFEWTGEGGGHNVAERETGERYESERTGEGGSRFDITFDSDGISKYICMPHVANGMKGAVAVGSGEGAPELTVGEMVAGSEAGGDGGGEGEGGGSDGESEGEGEGEGGTSIDPLSVLSSPFGLSAVIALLSPLVVAVLMRREESGEE